MEQEHSLHWVKDTTNQLMLGCSCNDYLLCNKMKTWKQEFLMMVGLYISILTAFGYRGKGHLAYYMRLLHSDSLALSFPLEGGW